ncbi:hypothetical protein EBZ37_08680 [bacterium]|nr:hypothetical protein [bacterium]
MARAVLLALFLFASGAQATVRSGDFQPTLGQSLLREILTEKNSSFSTLISTWRTRHGSVAISPLLELAEDQKLPEKARTIAILGAAELSKKQPEQVRSRLVSLLKDRLWLIRISAIKGLEAVSPDPSAAEIAGLLKDPALVVRSQAADTLLRMATTQANRLNTRPQVLKALSQAMHAPENYSNNKALWVPQKALAALVASRAKSELPEIVKLLDLRADPKLVQMAIFGLEKITGEKRGKWTAAEWKRRLAGRG